MQVFAFMRNSRLKHTCCWFWVGLLLLLLGAHFYRAREYGLLLCMTGMMLFHASRSAWKHYAVSFILLCGMLEWFQAANVIMQVRMMMDLPWMRAAGILVIVAFLTGLGGAVQYRQAGKGIDEGEDADALLKARVFIAVFVILYTIRQNVPVEMLLLERFFHGYGAVQIFLAAWYGAFVAGILIDGKRRQQWRILLWLIFGTAFFAQFALGLMGLEKMLLSGRLHVPIPAFILYGPLFRDSLSPMPFIVLVSVLSLGTAWCSMLCYFGPFDALACGNKRMRPLPPFLRSCLRWGRIMLLFFGIGMTYWLSLSDLQTEIVLSIAISYGVLSMMIMAGISRRYGVMLHCSTACPMGLIVSVCGRLSPWRLKVDRQRCNDCGRCEQACRWQAITAETRAQGRPLLRCTLCRDCIGSCSRKALSLRCAGLDPQTSDRLFSGMLAVSMAVFLAVAMV